MKPKDVDEYIALAPKEVQNMLKEFRTTIKTAAHRNALVMGCRITITKGLLVYFGHSKKHIGLYIPTSIVKEHKSELKGYETIKATVRFPLVGIEICSRQSPSRT